MTHDERVSAVRLQGYTPRQAAFLAMVLVHGGYFLRRQFARFLERHDGGLVTAFVHALVERGHARRHVFRRRVEVLHVRSRHLYRAFGDGDSRFRRPVSLASIVERLMTLDLALAHPGARFLVNEWEKREYVAGLPESALPSRWVALGRPGVQQHVRYFTDGRPVFIEPPDGHLHVAYVHGPAATLAGFAHFLEDYQRLLGRLPSPTVHLCAAFGGCAVEAARARFEWWRRTAPSRGRAEAEALRRDLTEYCDLRWRVESWAAYGVETALLARARARFSGSQFEGLYERWKAHSSRAIDDFVELDRCPDLGHVQLQVEVLPHRYGFFGSALTPLAERRVRRVA
jgi:hypothetical protein